MVSSPMNSLKLNIIINTRHQVHHYVLDDNFSWHTVHQEVVDLLSYRLQSMKKNRIKQQITQPSIY